MLLSVPFLYFKKKSGIDKWTEWSTIPACPSLMYFFFFNRGNTEGTNFRKLCFDIGVCFVVCKFTSGLISWFLENLGFDDLCAS